MEASNAFIYQSLPADQLYNPQIPPPADPSSPYASRVARVPYPPQNVPISNVNNPFMAGMQVPMAYGNQPPPPPNQAHMYRQSEPVPLAPRAPVHSSPRQPVMQPQPSAATAPPPPPPPPPRAQPAEPSAAPADSTGADVHKDGDSSLKGMKKIPNPPQLAEWRERLFHVHEMITLTEEEFTTYFPHVDNVYSHRSTQRYKKNPFVAHYWDCRLKGRPPGTKKSDDPTKKKRKRIARERDQCDVKIKIMEFFPGVVLPSGYDAAAVTAPEAGHPQIRGGPATSIVPQPPTGPAGAGGPSEAGWTMPLVSPGGASIPQASAAGQRIYTIQRVNGGIANAKGEPGPPSTHRHDLDYSDQIKKNSLVREQLKVEKELKKTQKTYHKKATGLALETVKAHSRENPLKLYGSCFCPFVQRVWISLEHKGIAYQYVEVDPYKKPQSLLEVNPRGLVPALRHDDWSCHESTVLMEYLEDLRIGAPLLPGNAKARAHSRLWADHVNRHIIPTFYHYLQAQEEPKQIAEAANMRQHLETLINAAASPGPFFLGDQMSFVDVQMAPWVLRFRRVLKPYRGWPDPEPGSRWEAWVRAIETAEAVKATTSDDVLYIESYERYAENRPDTSQVAKAVNEGRGLP